MSNPHRRTKLVTVELSFDPRAEATIETQIIEIKDYFGFEPTNLDDLSRGVTTPIFG